jgi:hypothetical protein
MVSFSETPSNAKRRFEMVSLASQLSQFGPAIGEGKGFATSSSSSFFFLKALASPSQLASIKTFDFITFKAALFSLK